MRVPEIFRASQNIFAPRTPPRAYAHVRTRVGTCMQVRVREPGYLELLKIWA